MPTSEVFNIDRKKGLSMYGDGHFNLTIDDPPYFKGPESRLYYGKEINSLNIRRKDYPIIKKWAVPGASYFRELQRVSQEQIIWSCNYFKLHFGAGRIVWDKCNQTSSFSDCEIAYCSLHDSIRMIRYMWNGFCQGKSLAEGHIMQGDKRKNEIRIHQTQKPVLLYKWVLSKYAQTGWKILDPHMGSQSLRIACYEMGFDYVGFELDKKIFEAGCARFDLHIQQQSLFNSFT